MSTFFVLVALLSVSSTAEFMGLPIAQTRAQKLNEALQSKGAHASAVPLYTAPKLPRVSGTGDTSFDKASRELEDALETTFQAEPFTNKSEDLRLRLAMTEGEAEIAVSRCPADDMIANVIVSYPKAMNNPSHFTTVTRQISSDVGRGPDSSQSSDGVILTWNFKDQTSIIAIYKNSDARVGGWIAPISVSYLGLLKTQMCHLNFLRLK